MLSKATREIMPRTKTIGFTNKMTGNAKLRVLSLDGI